MSLINNIITKEWLRSLLAVFFILFLLASIGDIINGFMRGREAQRVLLDYLFKAPLFLSKILPLSCLIGSLFSINKLKESNELTAILASGFHPKRIYTLIFFSATFIAFIQYLNIGYLDPYATKQKRIYGDESDNKKKSMTVTSGSSDEGKIWYKGENYFVSFDIFDVEKNRLINPSFYFYDIDLYHLTQVLNADAAQFDSKGFWTLRNVQVLDDLDREEFLKKRTPLSKELFIEETPSFFSELQSDLTTLKLLNLYRFVQKLDRSGLNSNEYKVLVYQKFSAIVVCIIFALIPLYSIFNPNRRSNSFGRSVVLILLFSIGFSVADNSLAALGSAGTIPPSLAISLTPALISLFIVYFYYKSQKL